MAALWGLNVALFPFPRAQEQELGLQMSQGGVRIVRIPQNPGRLPLDTKLHQPLANVAARARPCRPGRMGIGVAATDPLGG